MTCETVTMVAYLMGNPWPICHDCHRHVYMIEDTGEWRHFPHQKEARQQESHDGQSDTSLADGPSTLPEPPIGAL